MGTDKADELELIAQEIRELEQSPLYSYRRRHGYLPVPGIGSAEADLMLVGEAPGRQEAEAGRPFVGRAGEVLDQLLESLDLDREDVYITNLVKDRSPGNRDPRAEEIEVYAPFLLREIAIVEPVAIGSLGRFATDFVLKRYARRGHGRTMDDLHGKVLRGDAPHGKVRIVPLYHPAAVFYNRRLKEIMREDFQVLAQLV